MPFYPKGIGGPAGEFAAKRKNHALLPEGAWNLDRYYVQGREEFIITNFLKPAHCEAIITLLVQTSHRISVSQ